MVRGVSCGGGWCFLKSFVLCEIGWTIWLGQTLGQRYGYGDPATTWKGFITVLIIFSVRTFMEFLREGENEGANERLGHSGSNGPFPVIFTAAVSGSTPFYSSVREESEVKLPIGI